MKELADDKQKLLPETSLVLKPYLIGFQAERGIRNGPMHKRSVR